MHTVIRNNRIRLGLAQHELAQLVGCQRVTIASYESGHIRPSLTMAKKLAKVFGISLDELTKESPPREPVRGRPRKAVAPLAP